MTPVAPSAIKLPISTPGTQRREDGSWMDAEQSWEEEAKSSVTSTSLSLEGKKGPLEPYRTLGSGRCAAVAHTLREVPFLTYKNASVFSCPVLIACASCWSPRGQAASTRQWLWDVQRLREPIETDLFLAWAFQEVQKE